MLCAALLRSGWQPGDADGGWGELGALVPELAGRPGRGTPEPGSPGRLQGSFLRLVETLCRDRPVVVVVEDLHWSDVSTRALLMYTLRAAREVPLLLVGTYRSDDLTRRHPLRPFLAEVARLPSTEVIELERLDAAAVARARCRDSRREASAAGSLTTCTGAVGATRSSSRR